MSQPPNLYIVDDSGTEFSFDDGDGGLRSCDECGGTIFGIIDDTGEVMCTGCDTVMGEMDD